MSVIGKMLRRILERSGSKRSLGEWSAELEESGESVTSRFRDSTGTAKQRQNGRHIIGIERWGQSRIRVFLGAQLVNDEYDSYQPAEELDIAALTGAFADTRKETVALAREMDAAGISDTATVCHNDMGELTARGWLAYLSSHATRESNRL